MLHFNAFYTTHRLLTGWYRGKPSARSAHVIWSHECDVVVQWDDEPMSRCVLDDDQMMVISCDITTLPMWLPREPGGSSQTKLLCCIHVHICSYIFFKRKSWTPYTNRFKPIKAFRFPSTPNDVWWAWPKSISRKHQLQALPFAQKPPKPVAFSGRTTGAVEGKVNNDTNNNR